MPGHDLIVIGTSAGGLKALGTIVSALLPDLNAVILIVQHVAADHASILPQILTDVGTLPAAHPVDGEKMQKGRIYVAPPDHHLLVQHEYLRLVRGPKENGFRPAIDALFRSAARAYGPRVVGVVLTGYLDDGTIGLQAIKKRGGVAIVQDPQEAEYPSMAKSAMRFVKVDYCLPLAKMPALLVQLVDEPAAPAEAYPVPQDIEVEANIAEQKMNMQEFLENVETIGTRTTYTCPECNGLLWQIGNDEPLRFRCHTGHSFTAGVLLDEQSQKLEGALWSAVRVMEDKVMFLRQLAQRMESHQLIESATKYQERARRLDEEICLIRDIMINGIATRQATFET
jgi:two-component system, chemotaxis family, protein-glutamate methylesterase/glutaminase